MIIETPDRIEGQNITDYEVRRELLRAERMRSVTKLDKLGAALGYLPITTPVMHKAAENTGHRR